MALSSFLRSRPFSDRSVALLHTSITSVLSKGSAAIINVLLVPIVAPYLGVERFATWITILSIHSFIQFADLGISSGLVNLLSATNFEQSGDKSRRYVSNALFMLMLAMVCAIVIGFIVIELLQGGRVLFGMTSQPAIQEVKNSLFALMIFSAIGIPASLADRTLFAIRKGVAANFWMTLSNIVGLVAVIFGIQLQADGAMLLCLFWGSSVAIRLLSAIWLFKYSSPNLAPSFRLIRARESKQLLGLGIGYFGTHLGTLLTLNTANIMLASQSTSSEVILFSSTWRLFSLSAFLQSVIAVPMWSAYAEAFAKRDHAWIQRVFVRTNLVTCISTVLLVTGISIITPTLISRWTDGEVRVPLLLLICMSAWFLLSAFLAQLANVTSGSGRLRGMMMSGILAGVAHVVLSWWLAPSHGAIGVTGSLFVTQLVFNAIPLGIITVRTVRALNGSAK